MILWFMRIVNTATGLVVKNAIGLVESGLFIRQKESRMDKRLGFGIGNGHLVLPLRNDKHFVVFGGPYLACPSIIDFKVKLAAEINAPSDFDLAIKDFSIPNKEAVDAAVRSVVPQILRGKTVYAGCRGGVGRTWLFLAILAKAFGVPRPVEYVRYVYFPTAVETRGQHYFVEEYAIPEDVVSAIKWARVKSYFSFRKCLTNLSNVL